MENKLNLPLKKKKNEAESPRLDPLMRALKALHSAGAPETMTEEELEHQRRSQEVLGRLTAPMAGMDYEEFSLGGMNAAWMRLKAPHGSRHAILYCHGGGYTSGNLGYARVLASKLAHVTGYDVLSFEYRLAPEHPYPAAVEDALRAWDHLMLLGYGARDVVLAGDSAGGNLALVLCHRLKAAANTYMALEHDLELVPILNKIDLPSAHPDEVAQEVEDVIGLPCLDAPRVSAKTGLNVDQVLERVVTDIPAPTGDPDAPLKALIFDSIYDSYKGVIVYIRVFEGTVKPGDTIRMMATSAEFTLVEVGHMGATNLSPCAQLQAGEVGYLTASIKTVQDTRVGDTVTLANNPTAEALPGYRQVKPMVFCGIYPADGAKYPDLKDALEKLQLNDASLTFELETSAALGFGFRCGFLGLLHMEIITERLEREFDLDIITTTPSVRYRLTLTDGTVEMIDNPSSYPDPSNIVKQEEPFVDVHLYTPNDYVGGLMDLCQNKRGVLIDMKYLDDVRVDLHYALPLGEIVYDFFDAIKSRSRGYASYDYEFKEYRESDLVKLDFLLNGDPVDALSMIVFRDNAYAKGRRICEKLRDNIPRNLFEIPVQAAIGGKIIARETVKAMRKDVLAKCYGGDISRKKKLLEKQKEGKKKMRQLGSVSLPSEAFTAVLKLDSDDD